ncbi:zinc-binding dehydrogenase [Chloroflexota bacterium]
MKIWAAVLYDPNTDLKIEEIELVGPAQGEILVKLVASGICHTDVSAAEGIIPVPMPIVLGHEGAGIVEQVGTGVSSLQPGDHVVLTGVGSCGKCRSCVTGQPVMCQVFRPLLFTGTLIGGQRRLQKNGQALNHFFAQSSFAEYAVVPQETAIKVRDDASLEIVCLLGCGGMTGIGSVRNKANLKAGASIAVFGCGGVGMSAIMAAKLTGAGKIIAVDILDSKLRAAEKLGANHLINATGEDAVERIKQLTRGGADFAIAAVGDTGVITQAFNSIIPGGKCVVAGAAPQGAKLNIDALSLMREKTIAGCTMGSGVPQQDIQAYIDLFMNGMLPIDRLVTKRYQLSDINDAIQALKDGEVIKPVIVY